MGERQVQRAAALWVYVCYHTSSQNCSTPTATSASCSQILSQPPLAPGLPTGFPGDPSKAQLCPGETPATVCAKAMWEHVCPRAAGKDEKFQRRKEKKLMSEKDSQAPTSDAAVPNPAAGRSPPNCSELYLCPHDGFDGSFKLLGVVVVNSPHVGLPNELFSIWVLGGHLKHSGASWILQSLLEWLLLPAHSWMAEEQQPHRHSGV